MYDKNFATWRFELTLYPKLNLYRCVVTKMYNFVWWDMVKIYPKCKRPCITMTKLLCGTNCLAVNKNVHLDRQLRLCSMCNLDEIEDTHHFILNCRAYTDLRHCLFETLHVEMSESGFQIVSNLSRQILLLVLLGLEIPIQYEDLVMLRYITCIHVHKMYQLRSVVDQDDT